MHYDVVIIGGGINGVGVAQAVSAAGYSCLLIEKTALAAATSSCSSKLIHGGLRYLESFDLSLVKESLFERKLLLKNATDLVSLKPFYIPVYSNTSRKPLTIRLGLSLYSVLGGLKQANRFSQVEPSTWRSLEGLKTNDLQAVFQYYDAQTDDAALTRSVMQSAIGLGANIECPAELTSANIHSSGCELVYRVNDKDTTVNCSTVVNASGPWVNQINKILQQTELSIDLVQGTHLVLKSPVIKACYYMEAPSDKRAIFLLPWKQGSLLGTTETLFNGNLSQIKSLDNEEEYLLSVLNHYFPNSKPLVINKMAGLRVLPKTAAGIFKRSRDTILQTDNTDKPVVISIYGGKLTVYRKTASKVVKLLQQTLTSRKPIADTKKLKLTPTE